MTRRRSGRDLTRAEQHLWNAVARTVDPLPGQQTPVPPPKAPRPGPGPNPATARPKADAGASGQHTPSAPARSPLDPADPRRERLVARGRLPIDAAIDLHGMRPEEADRATTAFIKGSVRRGHRVLLVITGKGSRESGEGRGVLRKRFLQNIELGLFGSEVSAVRPAHRRHGGGGAFYVFLKAPQGPRTTRPSAVTKASSLTSKRGRESR